jgi:hypothetical protein
MEIEGPGYGSLAERSQHDEAVAPGYDVFEDVPEEREGLYEQTVPLARYDVEAIVIPNGLE